MLPVNTVGNDKLMISVSAIVLTFNEEDYIRDCLQSLEWCDEIWIVDSGSTDRTIEVCLEFTANVVERPFTDFSDQRNWALENLKINADWVVFVDSDERVTRELYDEIRRRLGQEPFAGYYLPRKQLFWGKWLRYGECWPSYQLRLFRKDKGKYTRREVHESTLVDGPVGFMENPLIHISRESMSEVLIKLDHFTTLDAIRMYRTGQPLYALEESVSYSRLNRVYKKLFSILPAKPLMKFLWDYIFRQGFRDGYLGFVWAAIQGLYVFVAYFKLWEFRHGIVPLRPGLDTQRTSGA